LTADATFHWPKGEYGVLFPLSAYTDSMNFAKGIPRISQVVAVFVSVGDLLTTIRVCPPFSNDLLQAEI